MSELSNTQLPVNKASGRKILLILAVIFLLPFTIAKTMHLLNVHPTSYSYGKLIQPPQALTFPNLQDPKGTAFTAQQWLKKWNIVTIDATDCQGPCQAQVYLLRQINIALGKDASRVRRVLIAHASGNSETLIDLQKQNSDLIILTGKDSQMEQLMNQFGAVKGSIYLVDPKGNLMMHYPPDAKPKGILVDLKKLLKNNLEG